VAKSYLVTGGTGFVGSALTRALVKAGNRVRVIDDNSRGSLRRLADLEKDFEFVEGDVRDGEGVARAIRGVESVVHLAAVNGTEFFYSKPDVVLDVGVKGMVNVIDGCIRHGVGELIVASSAEAYQTPNRVPTDETVPLSVPDPLNPRYSYGASKLVSEVMALNFGRTRFDRVIVFRPHNIYGPDMGSEHVIPQFIQRIKRLTEESDANPVSLQDPAYVGVASMVVQGRPGFVRVRTPYVRDQDVRTPGTLLSRTMTCSAYSSRPISQRSRSAGASQLGTRT